MKTSENPWLKKKKRFNQIKAVVIIVTAIAGLALGLWWQTALFVIIAWVSHEVLWSDHIFYNPKTDYIYDLDSDSTIKAELQDGLITHSEKMLSPALNTWLLEVRLQAAPVRGRIYDPHITLRCGEKEQKQYFERGLSGKRYLNLSCFSDELRAQKPIQFNTTYCSLKNRTGKLHGFNHPDYTRQKVLVIAPHADDAELASFGLYSRSKDVHLITLTAGEVEMEDYYHVYDSPEKASLLKGRLRSMDGIAIPLWGGVAQERCIQLGYFCKRLKDMHNQPDTEFPSLTANCSDTRTFREFNSRKLSSDANGKPTWNNLVQDLVELLDDIQPEVIITPNPDIDPHPDHIYSTKALHQALELSVASPHTEMSYANHYRTTDHFGFGPAHTNSTVPPNLTDLGKLKIFSFPLSEDDQKRKSFALEMMHDLKTQKSSKKVIRQQLQKWLIKRDYNRYGSDSYFDKAIKNQEIYIKKKYNAAESEALL